jgi:Ca2+/H+ antiporter, TMEM165/GDT1 family
MNLIPFISAILIIGIAELGDKTQLLVLGLASKYPIEKVIGGVAAASATIMLIAVLVGEAIQKLIPGIFISILASAFFIIYGLMILRPKNEEEHEEDKVVKTKDPFWLVFTSFFLAELGDKTQLATFAIAAKYSSPVQVWLGATLGMIIVNLFGIAIGNILRNYLPEKTMNSVSGVIFIVFGVLTFLFMLLRV